MIPEAAGKPELSESFTYFAEALRLTSGLDGSAVIDGLLEGIHRGVWGEEKQ